MDTIEEACPPPRRLLVRPLPYPDEAITGYLVRLADSNGFFGLRELFRYVVELGEGDCKRGIALATGLSQDAIEGLVGPYPSYWETAGNLAGLTVQDFNQQTLRWCPSCLLEAPYLRKFWTLKPVCHCERHQTKLLERCPACGAAQSPSRSNLRSCQCGERISVADGLVDPTTSEIKLLGRLHFAFDGTHGLGPFEQLNPSAWVRLIRYFGQFEDGREPERPGQLGNLHDLDVAGRVFSRAAVLLDEWPANFNRLLESTLKNRPVSPSLRRSFGRLYRLIYRDLADPSFGFVREAFEAFINDSWWGTVCKRNRGLSTAVQVLHPRLTLRQAADSLGIGKKTLKHLVEASVILATEAKTTKGRALTTIHRAQLDLLGDLPASVLSLKDAAAALALPERRLRELIDAGVIKPMLHRREAKTSQWLISKTDIDLLNQLPGVEPGDGVSIKQILKNWRLRTGEFPDLVRAILNGSVELLKADQQSAFGNRICSRVSLTSWRQVAVGASQTLSVDQAAKVLGVKQQVAYALVHSGLIPTDRLHKPIQISRDALETFQREYVSLAELARVHRRSPRRLLLEVKAEPVCGPEVDGCRQYFFRRLDVAA